MIRIAQPLAYECRDALDAYFSKHPNPALQAACLPALDELLKRDVKLTGALAGWMGGLVYAVANDAKFPCGVDGVLNADFSAAWGVTMNTIRRRAAEIKRAFGWMPGFQ